VVAAVAVSLRAAAPVGAPEATLTTTWKEAVALAATEPLEKTMVPLAPTATESVRDQPVPVRTAADTRVVFAGSASLTVTVLASLGPLLAKLIVYVRLFPAVTGSGVSVRLVIATSAWVITVVVAVWELLLEVESTVFESVVLAVAVSVIVELSASLD